MRRSTRPSTSRSATARRLDVVAVEAPSYGQALDAAATTTTTAAPLPTDPDVDKQWALSSFPFTALWACSKGAGITVGIVDSGVQGDHPDLAGRVLGGASIQGGAVTPGGGTTDVNGHGTHVAGIIGAGVNGVGIVGVAPEVTILPVRVLDSNGVGANSDIGAGITWAVDHGANVVNISIGSNTNSPSVSSAVDYAVQRGVTVVAAAGNNHQLSPPDVPQYPAALDSTVAVAALSQSGGIAGYSTTGAYVDVAAPGSTIWSSIPPSTWGTKSGTSMAAPHVAALIALDPRVAGQRGAGGHARPSDDRPRPTPDRPASTRCSAGAASTRSVRWTLLSPPALARVSAAQWPARELVDGLDARGREVDVEAVHALGEQAGVARRVLERAIVRPHPDHVPGGVRAGDHVGREHLDALVPGRELQDPLSGGQRGTAQDPATRGCQPR